MRLKEIRHVRHGLLEGREVIVEKFAGSEDVDASEVPQGADVTQIPGYKNLGLGRQGAFQDAVVGVFPLDDVDTVPRFYNLKN